MCIHYTVEFWAPFSNPSAEAERRVVRGLQRPGQNPQAKTLSFWLHANEIWSQPVCNDIREGGVYYNRVFEFCFEDTHCRERLESFEFAYERARNASRYADARGEAPGTRRELAAQWKRAYDEWVSAYNSHKDCPQTRNRHDHFNALRAARVCVGMLGLPEGLRLGRDPNGVIMPAAGFQSELQVPEKGSPAGPPGRWPRR